MEHFSLINFLTISIPEEFCMALFAWAILGKRDEVKFRSVLLAAGISAVSFVLLNIIFFMNFEVYAALQVVAFALVLYFIYKLNYLETIIGTLLTFIVLGVVQYAGLSIASMVGIDYKVMPDGSLWKIVLPLIECMVLAIISCIFIVNNLIIFKFRKKEVSLFNKSKIRYLVLQLTFAVIVMMINCKIMYENGNILIDKSNLIILIINILVVLVFTILTLRSAIQMSVRLQKYEEDKRKLDSCEIIQNIDYMINLIENNEYDDVKRLLKTVRSEVGLGYRYREKN